MRVRFIKDTAVIVYNKITDISDKFFRRNDVIECEKVIPLSKGFSDIQLSSDECLVDVKNDSFRVEVT